MKPSIFISHSSVDSEQIRNIRDDFESRQVNSGEGNFRHLEMHSIMQHVDMGKTTLLTKIYAPAVVVWLEQLQPIVQSDISGFLAFDPSLDDPSPYLTQYPSPGHDKGNTRIKSHKDIPPACNPQSTLQETLDMPQHDLNAIWGGVKESLRRHLEPGAFDLWISRTRLVELTDAGARVEAPDELHAAFLDNYFHVDIQNALEVNLGVRRPVIFAGLAQDVVTPEAAQPILPSVGRLNEAYTFDNFVVETNNEFAAAACHAVAKNPARAYNPLFFFGGTGLGKTHLMHAIAREILRNKPRTRVVCVTSEEFTNEFISAIGNSSLPQFRKNYRNADVLLIDDVQFFGDKGRSQDEFFHTFNQFHDGHKQIVLTCDRMPSAINGLEKRLMSRLSVELQRIRRWTSSRFDIPEAHLKTLREWRSFFRKEHSVCLKEFPSSIDLEPRGTRKAFVCVERQINCPSCLAILIKQPESYGGQAAPCPNCNATILLPWIAPATPSMKILTRDEDLAFGCGRDMGGSSWTEGGPGRLKEPKTKLGLGKNEKPNTAKATPQPRNNSKPIAEDVKLIQKAPARYIPPVMKRSRDFCHSFRIST